MVQKPTIITELIRKGQCLAQPFLSKVGSKKKNGRMDAVMGTAMAIATGHTLNGGLETNNNSGGGEGVKRKGERGYFTSA